MSEEVSWTLTDDATGTVILSGGASLWANYIMCTSCIWMY